METRDQFVTFADYWQEYFQACVPSQAGAVQRLETKRAFYAGAKALSCLLQFIGEHCDPEEWAAQSTAIHDEIMSDGAQLSMPPTIGGMQ